MSDHSAVLIWNPPADNHSISDYQILKNGHLITTSGKNVIANSASYPFIKHFQKKYHGDHFTQKVIWQNAKITGLKPNQYYRFQVRAIDKNGKVITTSNSLTVTTATTPKVLKITSYGAKGDGQHDNTKAIQNAINSCSKHCVVEVPKGNFVTGAIFLRSNMTFKVDKGAMFIGSTSASDYPLLSGKKRSALINVRQSSATSAKTYSNVRIVGQGIIDGHGWTHKSGYKNYIGQSQPHYVHGSNKLYKQYGILAKSEVEQGIKKGMSVHNSYSKMRSNLLFVRKTTNFYMEGVTLRNPADHGIVSSSTTNMTLNGVKVETYDVNNGDGIDISRSTNTKVFNSYFDVGDDALNFAAGAGAAAASQKGVNGAWLFNNFIAHAHGGVVLGSKTGSGISNIKAENNVMVGTQVGLRAKSNDATGGGATNVTFRNTAMANIQKNVVQVTLQYGDPNGSSSFKAAKTPAQFSNFYVSHLSVNGQSGKKASIFIVGDFKHKAYQKNLYFDKIHMKGVNVTDIEDLHDSHFNNITFGSLKSPWHFKNVSNVTVNGKKE